MPLNAERLRKPHDPSHARNLKLAMAWLLWMQPHGMGRLKRAEKENEEQARLLGKGGEREARLITERDHYKQALEEISTTIQEYKDSMVQEPAEDFIWAIKAWADKKLREI